MDFLTSHAAYTLHIQDAQRAVQERERGRIVRERIAEQSEGMDAVEPRRRPRGIPFIAFLRARRAAAQ